MVNLNRIYTRTGDTGKTSLGDGKRLPKTDPRIAALGAVDELNGSLGVTLAHTPEQPHADWLKQIQNVLFDLGADLSVPVSRNSQEKPPLRITQKQIEQLESQIDTINENLTSLDSFILPGGTINAAHLHMARTICRRAELTVLQLQEAAPGSVNQHTVTYLNRLSDLLFVFARNANQTGNSDILWKPGG